MKVIMEPIRNEYPELYKETNKYLAYRFLKCMVGTGLVSFVPLYYGAYKWVGVQSMIDKLEPLIIEEQNKESSIHYLELKDESCNMIDEGIIKEEFS